MSVLNVDLSERPSKAGSATGPAFVTFWWRSLPLGAQGFSSSELPLSNGLLDQLANDLGAGQLAARDPRFGELPSALDDGHVKRHACPSIANAEADHLTRLDRLGDPAADLRTSVSLIVCTRDRVEDLANCIGRLLALQPRPEEIIIVDNSDSGSARSLVEREPALTYVHEPKAGLSIARNTGVRASRGDIIVFTDDDAEPTPNWAAELAYAITENDVDAVTGLVLPASLDTEAASAFQFELGGFGSGFLPVMFDQRFFEAARPRGAQVWRIGAGANMAFRRECLERVGLFDERLGAGASGCSEDSEIWYRILAAGGRCLYEPRAVVFHHHRADWRALRRQLRAYMSGHVAALIAQYDRHGDSGNLKRVFVQLPRYLAGTFLRCLLRWHPRRLSLLRDEAAGWLLGMTYLLRPRWRSRRHLPRLERSAHA